MRYYLIVSLLLLLMYCAQAMPEEYLFEGERLSQPTASVFLGKEKYEVYVVGSDKFVIGPNGNLAGEVATKSVLFSYNTHLYIVNNEVRIKNEYHQTYNLLVDKTHTYEQAILDAFQLLSKQCISVPYLEVISLCVEPSEKLDIMKVGWVRKVPDWDVALDNYRKLGGEVFYLSASPYNIKSEEVFVVHKDVLATYSFLSVAAEITDEPFITDDIISPYVMENAVSSATLSDYATQEQRLKRLVEEEGSKKDQAQALLEDISSDIGKIILMNGNYSELNEQRQSLQMQLNQIRPGNYIYRSDIRKLDAVILNANSLQDKVLEQAEVDSSVLEQKWFIARWYNRLVGGLKWFWFTLSS